MLAAIQRPNRLPLKGSGEGQSYPQPFSQLADGLICRKRDPRSAVEAQGDLCILGGWGLKNG